VQTDTNKENSAWCWLQ